MAAKLAIHCFDFGRCSEFGEKRYVIYIKKHWWSRWKIRDWESKSLCIPRFYLTFEDAKNHL